LIWKRPFGDLSNLSWLRRHASEIHTQQQLVAALSSNRVGNGDAAPAAEAVAEVPASVSKN
jgi:hypothetical protein